MSYVIYHKESTFLLTSYRKHSYGSTNSYDTERAAKSALTRMDKAGKLGTTEAEVLVDMPDGTKGFKYVSVANTKDDFAIADATTFRNSIEKMVERINLMSGKPYMEAVNTPICCSPSRESYWSM